MAVERFPVEAGHILMFARSVGDPNPVYADAGYAAGTEVGGVIAPPTFVQASAQFDEAYPLRPKVGQPWFGSGKHASGRQRERGAGGSGAGGSGAGGSGAGGSGAGGSGGGGTGLHAEQHYVYHRPLRAGDVLTAQTRAGDTWEKEGKRAGKLVFSETITEYRDEQGELVVTARGVGVRTERVVES
jgi:acyl dehydratase